jgi:transposase
LGNYLKVEKKQQVIALLQLGWSYRRIEAETGVRRETVSRYDQLRRPKPATVFPGSEEVSEAISEDSGGIGDSNPAKVFPGSDSKAAKVFPGSRAPVRSSAAIHHDEIVDKVENKRLSAKRIFQDLVEDYGYAHSYESVKRYVRSLTRERRVVGVMHSEPGEEAQVDFFQGAPTFNASTGQWRRPWVFRMTLCCSRHGYEEAVWDQKLETFFRLHERAFLDFEGVPTIIRPDYVSRHIIRLMFPPRLCVGRGADAVLTWRRATAREHNDQRERSHSSKALSSRHTGFWGNAAEAFTGGKHAASACAFI